MVLDMEAHILYDLLYEISWVGKTSEIEKRSCQGLVERLLTGVTLWDNKHVLELDTGEGVHAVKAFGFYILTR